MHRRPAAALLFLAALASPVGAQVLGSAPVDVSIEVVTPAVTVTGVENLTFGAQPSGSVVRSSEVITMAQWHLDLTAGAQYRLSFILPSMLTGAAGSVPISFGPTSFDIPGRVSGIDPNLPTSFDFGPATSLFVRLGADSVGDGTGDVVVNLADAPAGSYTGAIVLTVELP